MYTGTVEVETTYNQRAIETIRERMLELGITQADLSRLLGHKTHVPVGMYLNGKRHFSLNLLQKWYRALNIEWMGFTQPFQVEQKEEEINMATLYTVGPWTPASKKPEKEGPYLAVVRNRSTKNLTQHTLFFSTRDGMSDWWGLALMSGEITHWMDLPPLPEKEMPQ